MMNPYPVEVILVNNHKNKNLRGFIYHGYYTFIFLEKVTLYILGIDLATSVKFRRNLIMFGWWGSAEGSKLGKIEFGSVGESAEGSKIGKIEFGSVGKPTEGSKIGKIGFRSVGESATTIKTI